MTIFQECPNPIGPICVPSYFEFEHFTFSIPVKSSQCKYLIHPSLVYSLLIRPNSTPISLHLTAEDFVRTVGGCVFLHKMGIKKKKRKKEFNESNAFTLINYHGCLLCRELCSQSSRSFKIWWLWWSIQRLGLRNSKLKLKLLTPAMSIIGTKE